MRKYAGKVVNASSSEGFLDRCGQKAEEQGYKIRNCVKTAEQIELIVEWKLTSVRPSWQLNRKGSASFPNVSVLPQSSFPKFRTLSMRFRVLSTFIIWPIS